MTVPERPAGPRDRPGAPFVAVSHLVLRGTPEQIGYGLARAAAGVYGSAPRRMPPVLGRARRRWFAVNWPEHHERARGMAAAFGVDDDPSLCVDDLNGMPLAGGCSAVWSPPSGAEPAVIARNFDIHESVIGTAPPPAGQRLPALARPHVVEMHPDRGLSSVAVTGNNLSGCLEGINEAGLAVVELADGQGGTIRPAGGPQAGLDEAQLPRFLLDRCRTAAEAREALHGAKHYTRYSTCHFLIADASGDAFVWEREGDNVEHVVDAGAGPLVVTNHLLAPGVAPAGDSLARLRHLERRTRDGEGVHDALDEVRPEQFGIPEAVTLWRSEYRMAESSMIVRFLLGVEESRRYSAPVTVTL
ncbi:C45 family peptidase [Actinoplanes missouriensis]|uniref:C45 family peptidase n=1 Tax=Actinoplanes missouriensis TaxID=1866 RepID=UPI0033FB6655